MQIWIQVEMNILGSVRYKCRGPEHLKQNQLTGGFKRWDNNIVLLT